MSEKKPFLLRVDPTVMEALRRWADDDFRSLNGQIEFLLRRVLQDAGRLKQERSGPRAEREGRSGREGRLRTERKSGTGRGGGTDAGRAGGGQDGPD